MTEITRQKVTLINQRDGQERYTRYTLAEAVEMIRSGKLKSGNLLGEATERPRICFASAIKNQDGQRWTYIYNGMILLEINNLPDRRTAEEIRQEASLIDYTLLAFVGADGRSVKLVCQAAERNNWQNPEGYWQSEVEKFNLNAYAKLHYLYSTQLATIVSRMSRYFASDPSSPVVVPVGRQQQLISIGVLVCCVPLIVLYVFTQKTFVQSIVMTGSKE